MENRIRAMVYGLFVLGGTLCADPCGALQQRWKATVERLDQVDARCESRMNTVKRCGPADYQKYDELAKAAHTRGANARCEDQLNSLAESRSSGKIGSEEEFQQQYNALSAQCEEIWNKTWNEIWSQTLESCSKPLKTAEQECRQLRDPIQAQRAHLRAQMNELKCPVPAHN